MFLGTETVRKRDWVGPEVVADIAETQKAKYSRIRDSSLEKVCGRASSFPNAIEAFLMRTFVSVLN